MLPIRLQEVGTRHDGWQLTLTQLREFPSGYVSQVSIAYTQQSA